MRPKEGPVASRIPDFKSREEEALFWDTHDTTDFEDELKPIEVRVAKDLSSGVTVRFDPATLAKLRAKAHAQGIGPTTLVRMWVLERLRQDEKGEAGE